MQELIKKYYDDLAEKYDESRFSNSYGKFIHSQETKVLKKYISKNSIERNLDLACGTGRFLKFANYGVDISSNMIEVAKSKFPEVNFKMADGEQLPFDDGYFENIISFHLMMHLDENKVLKILSEVNRVLKNGGYFIFDIASEKRRKLTSYSGNSWHGNYQINLKQLNKWIKQDWKLINYHGIAFFPTHRISPSFRKKLLPIDNFFCNSILREYSSYLIFILKKK